MSNLTTSDFTSSIDGPNTAARRKIIGQCNRASHLQAVAATLAGAAMDAGSGIVLQPGNVREVFVQLVAACASGESMVVDVLKNGVSILSATLTINSTNGTAKAQIAASVAAGAAVVAGDVLTCSRTYVAGGGPSMTQTRIVVEYAPG